MVRRTLFASHLLVLLVLTDSIAAAESVAVSPSRAGMRLVATLHPDDARKSRALIRTSTALLLLRRGERWRHWRVLAIASGRVLLWHRGASRLEYLAFGHAHSNERAELERRAWPGITPLAPQRYRLSRRALVDALDRPQRYAGGVRFVPDARGGFALRMLSPDHALSALGLRVHDRLVAVNGRRLQNLNDVMRAYGALRHARHLELGVWRRGESLALQLEIE